MYPSGPAGDGGKGIKHRFGPVRACGCWWHQGLHRTRRIQPVPGRRAVECAVFTCDESRPRYLAIACATGKRMYDGLRPASARHRKWRQSEHSTLTADAASVSRAVQRTIGANEQVSLGSVPVGAVGPPSKEIKYRFGPDATRGSRRRQGIDDPPVIDPAVRSRAVKHSVLINRNRGRREFTTFSSRPEERMNKLSAS
jgi:hypothetical protein